MENDESVYDFLDEVIRFVVVRGEDDSTVNLCLIAKSYREQYLAVREIERGARFFLTPGKSEGGNDIVMDGRFLRIGYEKLKGYVTMFSKVDYCKDDLLKFLRRNRKRIKDELHINVNTLLPFVVARYANSDEMYFGFPRRSYFRHMANLERVTGYFDVVKRTEIEVMDMEVPFENTPLTSRVYRMEQLNDMIAQRKRYVQCMSDESYLSALNERMEKMKDEYWKVETLHVPKEVVPDSLSPEGLKDSVEAKGIKFDSDDCPF